MTVDQNNPSEETRESLIQKNSQALHIKPESYLRIVLSSFVESTQDILDLEKAIEGADHESIKMIAHRLKGVYGNLKLTGVSTPSKNIEELAVAQAEASKMNESFTCLKDAFESLQAKFN